MSKLHDERDDRRNARAVAPIANWVKPTKTGTTLAGNPSFKDLQDRDEAIRILRQEKFALENQLKATAGKLKDAHGRIAALKQQVAAFLRDERS